MLDMALRFCEVLESGNRGGSKRKEKEGEEEERNFNSKQFCWGQRFNF